MSHAEYVINAMGGPAKITFRLSQLKGRPMGLSTVQRWKDRKGGIPPLWRDFIREHAEAFGIQNDPVALKYLQLEDAI